MVSQAMEKLLKDVHFICLLSDNVVDNPVASQGVRDTAFQLVRPRVQKIAFEAVKIMTEVVQKKEVSGDVNSFFLAIYTVLGDDIYEMIFLKIADDITEDDGIFMMRNYTSVARLRMEDFKKIFDKIAKKSGSTTETDTTMADSINQQTVTFDTAPQARSWLSRIFNLKVIHSLFFFVGILLKSASAGRPLGSNLVGRPEDSWGIVEQAGQEDSWGIMRSKRLCDLVPETNQSKAQSTWSASLQCEIDEHVAVANSVNLPDLDWYIAREKPINASLITFADIDDLFPEEIPLTISEPLAIDPHDDSTAFDELLASKPLRNEQAAVTASTLDANLMDTLTKRQGTAIGSLFANVSDLFSTNELRPAFKERTLETDENATSEEAPEESDSTNGLGDFDLPDSDWQRTIGFIREPTEQASSTRSFPITMPEGILKDLENGNANQK